MATVEEKQEEFICEGGGTSLSSPSSKNIFKKQMNLAFFALLVCSFLQKLPKGLLRLAQCHDLALLQPVEAHAPVFRQRC